MGEPLHPMFQDILKRTDGWTDNVNESSLDYDFIKRHPQMSVIFLSFTGIAVAAGNIGNVLIIGAVMSYKRLLRNTGNFFVVNLAIADLLITSVVGPFNMIGVVRGPRFYIDKVFFCELLGSICTVSCIVSMLSIAAVAVNRVVCITKYFLYRTVYTKGKTLLYCIGLWLTALLVDLPNWIGWGGHTFGLKEMGCTFDRVKNYSYTIFLATFSIFIPIVIVLTSYLCVFMYVRHSRATLEKVSGRKHSIVKGKLIDNRENRKANARKEDLQLAFTLFLTFLAFLICWSPYMIGMIFDHKDEWPKELYVFGTLLGHSNSCLNSVIYAMCNQRFRQGYYIFFHKILCMKITKDSLLKDSRNGFTSLKYTSRINSKLSSSPSHIQHYQLV